MLAVCQMGRAEGELGHALRAVWQGRQKENTASGHRPTEWSADRASQVGASQHGQHVSCCVSMSMSMYSSCLPFSVPWHVAR